MITLPVKPLLEFAKLGSIVQNNSILPIHNYIRLQAGTLAKTNGRIFVCQTLNVATDVNILLDEGAIMPFAKFSNDDEIKLTIETIEGSKDLKVTMSDSISEDTFQSPPIKDFDKLPEFTDDEDVNEFDSDVLQAIGIAKHCAGDVGGNANVDFVHLFDGYIFSTDTSKLYTKRIEGIPNAYFDKESASVISQFNSIKFKQSGSYNLFQTSNILYGFQQFGEVKPPNIKPFLKEQKGDFFEFESIDLINYCERVNASVRLKTQKEVAECDINGGELTCVKAEYGKTLKTSIKFKGDYKVKMRFNPKLLAPYIRSLGAPTIRFYEFGQVGVYVKDIDDKQFLGMFAGLKVL